MDEKVHGIWRDSEDNENVVSFKANWGGHRFSSEERSMLLAGKEIYFRYYGNDIVGHLQYFSYKGKTYFGFTPNFDPEYESSPVFRGSSFQMDLENEDVMAAFMRLNYY